MYLIILLLLCLIAQAPAQKNAIGKSVPTYATLEWIRPAAIQPHEFDSSVVILEFWATWCAPCMKHMPKLVELERAYKGRGVKVIAVSWDARPTQIDSFVHEHVVPQYVCIDRENMMFLKTYTERGIPYAIMFGRDGHAVWEGTADSLTERVIDSYLNTGTVPPDPTEEELTEFSFSVRRALASDKNGVGSDYPVNSVLEINAQSALGLITNTAWFLGLSNSKDEVIGEVPGGFYNLRLRIDTSLRNPAMRDRCLRQLDEIFGTQTTVKYSARTIYAVKLANDTRAMAGSSSLSDQQLKPVRLYSAIGSIQRKCGIEMIVDEVNLGELMISFPSTFSTLEEGIKYLGDAGLSVHKEERVLPTLVVTCPPR